MKSLKKNYLYNVIYQVLILIIPLITVPYVSRVIGANGIGTYSYTYSIVYYFMIFAMLGLNNYGNRTIAQIRDNREKLSKTFKEIYFMQIAVSLAVMLAYGIFIYLYNKEYLTIFYIQSLHLISCMFDINWLYYGLEEFKFTVFRNIIIKLLTLVLIFTLVNSSDDVITYVAILSGSTLLSQLILWPFITKYIDFKTKIVFSDIKKHFIPCLKLFLPVIAVTVYRIMDKTMLGIITNTSEVGYYENAEKIINVLVSIITALGVVMLPRMSNLYATGNDFKSKELIAKSIKAIMFISFPIMFGLMAISKDFSVLFFGSEFSKSGILIIYLSITIVFLAWGNVIRTQYLIPKEMDKEYIISAFLGAIVNLSCNLILIPIYQSIGACIGTIAAEFIVMLYQTIKVRKNLPISEYLHSIIPFIMSSLIMFIFMYLLKCLSMTLLFRIVLQVFIGIIIYVLLNKKYITSIIDINKVFKKKVIS